MSHLRVSDMMRVSEFPPGTVMKIGGVPCVLDGYSRSDPRFIHVTLTRTGEKVLLDSDVLAGAITRLDPLTALAYQAPGNKTGELSGKS